MPGKGKKALKDKNKKPDLDSPRKRYANGGKKKENDFQKLSERELSNGFVVFDTVPDAFDQGAQDRNSLFEDVVGDDRSSLFVNEGDQERNSLFENTGIQDRNSVFENVPGSGSVGFGEGGLDDLLEPREQEEKKDDPWAKKENWKEYVTEKPEPGSFLKKERYEKEYIEPANMSPVFETHTFSDLSVGLHSFMGLRYTKFDRKTGRLSRKRIQVGFGSQGGPMAQGRMMNEERNVATVSSETPISMDRFENVVGAIERTNANVEMVGHRSFFGRLFRSGKAKGTEFSGKYNLLTNNCNDFVIAMAKAAGVETPASLHKSILGPIAAARNLSNAAGEEELEGGTRIFHGARVEDAERHALLSDFMTQVRAAAKADGINISKVPELEAILLQLNDQSGKLGDMLKGSTQNVADLAGINENIRKALRFTGGKKHPKLNTTLLKFGNLTREAGQLSPDNNRLESLTKEEIDYAMTRRTTAEEQVMLQQAGEEQGISNKDLFKVGNAVEGSLTPMGAFFLMAVGAGGLVRGLDMSNKEVQAARIRQVADIFSENNIDKAKPFLDRYIKDRPYLSTEQAAKLLTLSIEQGMGQTSLAITQARLWSVDQDDKDYVNYKEKVEREFTGSGERQITSRVEQLDESKRLYMALFYIISVIRGDKVQKEKDER